MARKIPSRVLITRFSAIGDVAMTLPVVYGVCRSNPAVSFIYVSRPSMVSMMINRPPNLTVYGVDVSNSYKGIGGMRRLYAELAAHFDFDAMADLHSVLRTRLLGLFARLDGVRVARLDKGRAHRHALTRRHNKVLLPVMSMTSRYAAVFEDLGLEPPAGFTSLWGDGRAPHEAYSAVSAPKQEGERWIAVAPFARHRGKIYPPEKMRAVVERLIKQHPRSRIFLMGGGDTERRTLDAWAAELPGVTSLAGKKYGFPAELALMSHLDVMLSMDSANMHLASLAGVPVVSVWGATHPYCGFRAWGQTDTTAVQLTLDCRPCSIFGNKPCHRGDYLCMNGISPAVIAGKVASIIND